MVKYENVRLAPPVRFDWEASQVMGGGLVVNRDGDLVASCDTVDEAIALVAEVNGETQAQVLSTARVFSEYLWNVRHSGKK